MSRVQKEPSESKETPQNFMKLANIVHPKTNASFLPGSTTCVFVLHLGRHIQEPSSWGHFQRFC